MLRASGASAPCCFPVDPRRELAAIPRRYWLRGEDLNLQPSGYEPDALPVELPRHDHYRTLAAAFRVAIPAFAVITASRTFRIAAVRSGPAGT